MIFERGSQMPFRRATTRGVPLRGDALTHAMVGIGMNFAAEAQPDANVEDTLVAASVEGMVYDDLRVLAMLVTWLAVHHERINVDRLVRAVRHTTSDRVRAFWAAVATWLKKDRRLTRLKHVYAGPALELLRVGNPFQIRRRGEDARFEGTPLRVPAGVLRDRKTDVLSPAELAKRHRSYRFRIAMGPSYRADAWAALDANAALSPAEIARMTYGSFATAWCAKRDWELLHAGPTLVPPRQERRPV